MATKVGTIQDLVTRWDELKFDSTECHTTVGQIVRDIRKVQTADDIFTEEKPMLPSNTYITVGTELVSLAYQGFEGMEKFLWDIADIISYAENVVNAAKKEWGQI